MVDLFLSLLRALRSAFRSRANLALAKLALRQQLASLRRTSGRTHLRKADRAFWIVFSRLWSRWADVLVVVKPDTAVRWHRAGFRLFWRSKSRSCSQAEGDVSAEVKTLIRQMAEANVGWGAPRIHGELLKLGIDIGERSVSRWMLPKPRKPPSQTWRTFLDNHVGSLASIDFFTVPTATFRVLYVFFVLSHARRRVLHFNVTEFPSAQWTAQQIIEAFPEDTAPRYMIRDRDGIFGDQFRRRVEGIGIDDVEATLKNRDLATLASAAPFRSTTLVSLDLGIPVDRAERDRNSALLADPLHSYQHAVCRVGAAARQNNTVVIVVHSIGMTRDQDLLLAMLAGVVETVGDHIQPCAGSLVTRRCARSWQ
jgi:hypothetical protein